MEDLNAAWTAIVLDGSGLWEKGDVLHKYTVSCIFF